jgi:NAD(P)-dependent dehydrogenase (short-subunit alcohol dehydrogenase family)
MAPDANPNPTLPYARHNAIVFGGASGIGAATALLLAERGASVTIADLDEQGGQAVVAHCQATGAAAAFVHVDLADDAQVRDAVRASVDGHGALTMAANVAGIDRSAPLSELTEEDYEALFSINTGGLWRCLKHEIDAMCATGPGSIVNVGSIAGTLPVLGNSLYGASKAAVSSLTTSAAYEYAAAGIRVNEVAPGTTRTAMLDDWIAHVAGGEGLRVEDLERCVALGYLADPREQAAAIAFLLSDEASFITGASLVTDGGMSLLNRTVPTSSGIAPVTPGERVAQARVNSRVS